MKKGVLVGILVLALVVIVSPGIVGKMSEQSLDENLNRAADHSAELVVTSQGFERGWFSSEGEHRIELGDGNLRSAMLTVSGDTGDLPVLIINTKIDHGIIPVTSLSRDNGSLAPGLGSAVSTMKVQSGDGEEFEVPGAIYSSLNLNGDLESTYALEAGSHTEGDDSIEWQAVAIEIEADASSGGYVFDGEIGGIVANDANTTMTLGPVRFSGDQTPSGHGFFLGDVGFEMDSVVVNTYGTDATNLKGLSGSSSAELDGDRVTSTATMSLESVTVPQFGDIAMDLEASADADAAALGALIAAMESMSGNPDPAAGMAAAEGPAKDLFAAGIDFEMPKLDVALPMGTVEMVLAFSAPEQDRDTFEWTSLLLKGEASFDMRVPDALVQMATTMSPEVGGIIAMGYLRKEGDYYVMDADMEQGLLTVNGAPIPIPVGAF